MAVPTLQNPDSASAPTADPVQGAQAISRVFGLLRLIARHSPRGAGVTELARASGLTYPTTHRLLRAMVAEQVVQQNPTNKHYQLGWLAYELGLSAPQQQQLIKACWPILIEVARATSDTVYLIKRSVNDAVCLERIEAVSPIRTYAVAVGERRLLGIGAAGMALLSVLPDPEIKALIARYAREYAVCGLSAKQVWEGVEYARRTGYAINHGRTARGVSAIGVAVPGGASAPILGLSIGAITERISGERQEKLAKILFRQAAALGSRLLASPDWEAGMSAMWTPGARNSREKLEQFV